MVDEQRRYRFLDACRNTPVDVVPVWFMRQAGRSLPEYRALRERHDITTICRTPELAVEATLQPVRRLGVDAAILFGDIVVPLQAIDLGVEIVEGTGPVVADPIRSGADVGRLRALEPEEDVPDVIETIRILVKELDVPLIGFGGAPFTLASYLVEGGPSKNHARTKALMLGDTETWHRLMHALADIVLAYLRAQVEAGAAAIQLFDSWAGALSADDYVTYVMEAVEKILNGLADLNVPRIYFGLGTSELLPAIARSGTDVVGVDWRIGLDDARRRTGDAVALQGNLDPAVCLAPWDVIQERATIVLDQGGGRGHVFNLGHGVLPETDPHVLARLVDLVHGWGPRD